MPLIVDSVAITSSSGRCSSVSSETRPSATASARPWTYFAFAPDSPAARSCSAVSASSASGVGDAPVWLCFAWTGGFFAVLSAACLWMLSTGYLLRP